MKITNEKGVDVDDIIGPFDEDATLILVCIVTGGKQNNWFIPFLFFLKFKFTYVLFFFNIEKDNRVFMPLDRLEFIEPLLILMNDLIIKANLLFIFFFYCHAPLPITVRDSLQSRW